MKEISLRGERGKGLLALVDDEDYDYLNRFKWYLDSKGYAFRNTTLKECERRTTKRMHREILNTILDIDHEDHNTLNNQKYNLRPSSKSDNSKNCRKKRHYKGKPTTSKYKGVTYIVKPKYKRNWRMTIRLSDGTNIDKLFESEIEAAHAYDKYASQDFGEYAVLNFLKESPDQ